MGSVGGIRDGAERSGTEAASADLLHVLAPAAFGGLERVVELLAAGQRRAGRRVAALALLDPDSPDHPCLARLRAAGVATYSTSFRARSYLREVRAIREMARILGARVVHTHGYRADVLGGLAAGGRGVAAVTGRRPAAVTTVHGFTGGSWKNLVYERLQRLSHRRFDAVVAVSRPLMDRLAAAGVARSRLHLVPNAWEERRPALPREEARRALGVPAETVLLGWVGRLSAEKGPDLLLEGLARTNGLAGAAAAAEACFIGDGPERDALRRRAAELGIGGRVRWTGTVDDAGRLFPAFDAFVLSSRTEGTPIVLFEAMAAGVPIVAAEVGGVPDVVSGAEAVLVPPEDPDALAAGIRRVLAAPDAAADRAAAAGRRLETDFALGPWLERYEDVYRAAGGREGAG